MFTIAALIFRAAVILPWTKTVLSVFGDGYTYQGKLWTYLDALNGQAENRLECIITQVKAAEGVTEDVKAYDQMAWVEAMNSIRSYAKEMIRAEMIDC